MYKRHSLIPDYNQLYNPLPILSSFPSRRPSMCVLTDQVMELAREERAIEEEGWIDVSETVLEVDIESDQC